MVESDVTRQVEEEEEEENCGDLGEVGLGRGEEEEVLVAFDRPCSRLSTRGFLKKCKWRRRRRGGGGFDCNIIISRSYRR
jgi:hypothetical protein